MSFFAYMCILFDGQENKDVLTGHLNSQNFIFHEVYLAREFGVSTLYGIDALCEEIFELELTGKHMPDGRFIDIESALLDPRQEDARWNHYKVCAERLGRSVNDFRDDSMVDEMYAKTSIDLGIIDFIESISNIVTKRPFIINLDPEFQIQLGYVTVLQGMDQIRQVVWEYTVFSDLETPLRLVIE